MRKTIFCFAIIASFAGSLFGQKLHTPAEIFILMEKSSISYNLNALTKLDKPILAPDRTEKLNYNDYYRQEVNGKPTVKKYQWSEEVKADFDKAENYFQENNLPLARGLYQEALSRDSGCYKAMTYIGQTFDMEGFHAKAIEWYQKAIDKNYIDYMNHWFIADSYSAIGENNKAVDEITIAWILNRNNPRISNAVKRIYELKKIKVPTWTFTPQMQIDSIQGNKVTVHFQVEWLGYAMVKALWLYEPGYKESMGYQEDKLNTTEEKEAILNLLSSLSKKKWKKIPELKALRKALDKNMVNEFIFFEIYLPEHPAIVYQLTDSFIQSIKEYILTVKCAK